MPKSDTSSTRKGGKRSREVQQEELYEGVYKRTSDPRIKKAYNEWLRNHKQELWTYEKVCREQM